jgi:RHS repeat-associated protein
VYNEDGFLEQVRDVTTPEDPYWIAERRNPAGQLLDETYGNGVLSSYEYQDSTGLLSAIDITGPGDVGALAALSYIYDPNRNIDLRTDSLRSRTDDYGYDELNRLTTWTASNGRVSLTATYDYDVIGNLEAETVQGVPNQNATYVHGEDGAPPHALTSRNGAVYTYDDAGRQVTGPGRTIDYNRLGLPKSITRGQTGLRTEFAYDASGTRVRKRETGTGGATVVYVGGLFERRVPAGTNGTEIHNLHNIVADGRVIAQINRVQPASGGTPIRTSSSYLHRDAQGSTTLVTNSVGRTHIAEDFLPELFYDPWGRRIDSDYKPLGANRRGGPRQGFTGHEHEDEFGLINMIGRIYDPEARRFLTPDPFIQDPLSSQSHNRYSYVWNNPSTFTDPTGFYTEEGGSDDDPAPVTLPDQPPIEITGSSYFEDDDCEACTVQLALLQDIVRELNARIEALAEANAVQGAAMSVRSGPTSASPGEAALLTWKQWNHLWNVRRQVALSVIEEGADVYGLGDAEAAALLALASAQLEVGTRVLDLLEARAAMGEPITDVNEVSREAAKIAVGQQIAYTLAAVGLGIAATGGRGTSDLLQQARAARDELAGKLGSLPASQRPATVTGGYNPRTGEVTARACGGGKCAEDHVRDALGRGTRYTEAVRPRPHGPPYREVDVCTRCESRYGRDAFPPGTTFKSDR